VVIVTCALVIGVLLAPWAAAAQTAPMMGGQGGQMPDPKKISGVPLPVSDVPTGTVTVRVIRGQFSNPLPGLVVQLGDKTATTDSAGRAQFSQLPAGTRVKASVTVTSEKIESQEFDVPANGGIRLVLVATDAETEKRTAEDRRLAQAPAVSGVVVLGSQSRFVIEVGDDALNVFSILQIVNTARTPVQPPAPLVFDLPKGATGAGVLEGSAPNAVAARKQVTVSGPFAPGNTMVQFAYSMPLGSDSVTIDQKLPAQMTELSVIVQKIGSMQLASPQIAAGREMSAEGQTYIVGHGPAVRAGDTVSLSLTGLPHRATWPRNVALTLALGILAAGAWGTMWKRAPDEDSRRVRLEARRERLLSELASLEQEKQRGDVDEAEYSARRRDFMIALDEVYTRLDQGTAA